MNLNPGCCFINMIPKCIFKYVFFLTLGLNQMLSTNEKKNSNLSSVVIALIDFTQHQVHLL